MAKARAKRKGRQKGSRNRGYFFIQDRGWVANVNGSRVPLEYENGDRMRDENTPLADVKAAYFRLMAAPFTGDNKECERARNNAIPSLAQTVDFGCVDRN